jgi:hypothetical protein
MGHAAGQVKLNMKFFFSFVSRQSGAALGRPAVFIFTSQFLSTLKETTLAGLREGQQAVI